MENYHFLFILIIASFSFLALSYKLFGINGVYIYVITCVIAANIQVNKFVHYLDINEFPINATLGNVMFGTVFLATDFINEKYGKEKAQQVVNYSIFANLSFVAVMVIASFFHQFNVDEHSSLFNQSFDALFSINGNVVKAVLIGNFVYFCSQVLDISIYKKLKTMWPGKKTLFIRNNVSTAFSQIFDTILVSLLFSMAGIIPFEYILGVILSTLAIKAIIALLDTPFLYIMSWITPRSGK